ncbi:MAG: hypothetical protein AB7F31_07425 [Parachlamydiales bacterium]
MAERKTPKIKKLDTPGRRELIGTLQEMPRPKLSRPFTHRAVRQGDSRLAARLEKLLGLRHKERRDSGLRLARAALSTLNLLLGSEQLAVARQEAKRSVSRAESTLSPPLTAWMLRTLLAFVRTAGPEGLITHVAFRGGGRRRDREEDPHHPLPKEGFDGEKQTTLYSSADFYRRDGVTRLYK